jgi:hypothetical protein
MVSSILILILSTALFFFYIHTICENVLRREFRYAYFQDVLNAIDLDFPRLQQALSINAPTNYSQVRLALKCDYFTLTYLLKNGDSKRPRFTRQEKLLIGYFRLLLLLLPVRYAFHFHAEHAAMKLTVILHHFANLVGERVTSAAVPSMAHSQQS